MMIVSMYQTPFRPKALPRYLRYNYTGKNVYEVCHACIFLSRKVHFIIHYLVFQVSGTVV